ncbi:glycosyltransferase [Aquicoccus porphyridii]|uniref:Glycosyltransferase n=1 Tax=Aquicoccus porphyridii TaxID=1852029 RepID=A0A5A9Z511_9RHOB|nr:glycosyltransferase [Aquicoccus porphyridii]KAA0912277.1 glycosyltransferase [Aquicoccus porphyridii]RAI54234.1 glycosyltransferase family 2 protein [Rhodobacteraceae bacterium AsT-22]
MTPPPVSVVIVSRDRPESLIWCLTGVAGLRYPAFEVVVVADPQGVDAVRASRFDGRAKLIPFDRANISAARNLGIAQAAGEIVAFIDDDAVPEPTWLSFLTAPFANPDVAAAGGFVRGRNGISFQWKARMVDACGRAEPQRVDEAQPTVLHPGPGQAVKTEGTNMALRRQGLARIGGFDPNFRFYLDETDLNMRLARAGMATAIAPMAQVHHAYAASLRRSADRAVRDLHEIGASWAVFLRKHCPEEQRARRWQEVQNDERARLEDQQARGLIDEADVPRIFASLSGGFAEGQQRAIAPLPGIGAPQAEFLTAPGAKGPSVVLSGRSWQAGRLRREARERVARGETVSLFLFSPSTRFHRVRLSPEGVWEQVGGLFGRSERSEPLFRLAGFRARVNREARRVAALRAIGES